MFYYIPLSKKQTFEQKNFMQVQGISTAQGVKEVYRPTRRRFLHVLAGAVGLPTLATLLPFLTPASVLAAERPGDIPPHALRFTTGNDRDPGNKLVIIFMQGGLSFFDTFDPKTHESIRGPFRPIDTNARGVQITEILQPLARHMNKAVVINNLRGGNGFHDVGAALSLTTSPRVNGTAFFSEVPNTNPFIEFSNMLTNRASRDVGYVVLHQNSKDIHGYNRLFERPWDAVKPNDPETVYSAYDTNSGQFTNPFQGDRNFDRDRFRARMRLLDTFDSQGFTLVGESVERHNRSYQKARSMLDGDFNRAFDVSREPQEVLNRYGDSKIGKQLLLTRRMLQSGARVIVANDGNYDHHTGLEANMRMMIPPFAQALSALLDDIQRMDEKVYVAIISEFGRTPRLNPGGVEIVDGRSVRTGPGRDHWTDAYGMVVFGNDIRDGRMIGRTDNTGRIVGDSYNASMVGDSILELLGVGRFEKRGEVVTDRRFPYIDIRNV